MKTENTEERVIRELSTLNISIEEAKLCLKSVEVNQYFSFGTWTSRQHLFLVLRAGNESGYGECVISVNNPEVSLDESYNNINMLKGLSIKEAFSLLRTKRGIFPENIVEMAEMAIIDLAGKCLKKSAPDILGLKERKPVCGVYVILSDDPEDVANKTRFAIANKKSEFIKVKLFGDVELDKKIIKAVRDNSKNHDTFIIGDVNGGYKNIGEEKSLESIAACLKALHKAGLDACEDPAYIDNEEWVELQKQVSDLPLIPDYPLRPSREAVKTILPGMGGIYNIHPDSSGSIIDAVELAKRIYEIGAKLMIGDDSLIGPAATVWQQIAVGLGAEWVEATEKEKESRFYYDAVEDIPTDSIVNPISVKSCYGFGIYLDEKKLFNS
nr:hypothetical protein [uncultured Catonella sp.]